jgi:aminoglycoside/choline kinase family phosphotransferase
VTALSIPAGPQDLTTEWLTDALKRGGALAESNVLSFASTTIGEGAGLLGQLARLELKYDAPAPGAPRSLVAKFPAASEETRYICDLFRIYEVEVRFYEEIAPTMPLRGALCYYSAVDAETLDFVLLLEDLTSARVGDQLRGATREEAELAVRELAKFHAAWWDNPRLEELSWLPYPNAEIYRSLETSYQEAWEPFLANFGHGLPASVVKTGGQLGTNICNLLDMYAKPPLTIMHGDYRLDNLFFDLPDRSAPLAVIDWQLSSRSRAAGDIGLFMAGSVETSLRRATEQQILRMYHNTLLENGVQGYGFDQLFHDYRVAVVASFINPVLAGGALDLSNERGVALVTAWVDRCAAAIVDLDAGDVLPA